MTKIGIVVKSFQNDSWSVNLGIKCGIPMSPFINLMTATPAVITTKTTAKATDNADVYLNESNMNMKKENKSSTNSYKVAAI